MVFRGEDFPGAFAHRCEQFLDGNQETRIVIDEDKLFLPHDVAVAVWPLFPPNDLSACSAAWRTPESLSPSARTKAPSARRSANRPKASAAAWRRSRSESQRIAKNKLTASLCRLSLGTEGAGGGIIGAAVFVATAPTPASKWPTKWRTSGYDVQSPSMRESDAAAMRRTPLVESFSAMTNCAMALRLAKRPSAIAAASRTSESVSDSA